MAFFDRVPENADDLIVRKKKTLRNAHARKRILTGKPNRYFLRRETENEFASTFGNAIIWVTATISYRGVHRTRNTIIIIIIIIIYITRHTVGGIGIFAPSARGQRKNEIM